MRRTGAGAGGGGQEKANAVEPWREVPRRRGTSGQLTPEVLLVDKLGDLRSVCEIGGWEKIWAQIDSGAVHAVGPKEVAKAFNQDEVGQKREWMCCNKRERRRELRVKEGALCTQTPEKV